MLAVGIVCEYNPFHRGHLYQIETFRERLGADTAVVCAMSGDFVQRGEAAVFDKFARAEAACRCGADLVVELPLPWCLSSAEGFARGGVGLLGALGVSHICFGSETGELAPLKELSELLLEPTFNARVKNRLEREANLSYAAAREREAALLLGGTARLLEQPNNILALEYLKAIRMLGLPIRAMAIRRQGSAHDRDAAEGELRSAYEIRRRMAEGEPAEDDIPPEARAVFEREIEQGRTVINSQTMEAVVLSRLRMLSEEDCLRFPDAVDGPGNRLYRAIRETRSLDELYSAVKTKRYALSRIRRMCLCACLGIQEGMSAGVPPYARLLAANAKGRDYLRERGVTSSVPVLTKPAAVRELGTQSAALFTLGARAHDFYALFCREYDRIKPDEDWRKGPAIV